MATRNTVPQSHGTGYTVVQAMSTNAGRAARIVVGLIFVAVGWGIVGGWWGALIGVVGLVPIAAGLMNVCLVAPLFGQPLRASDLQ